MDELRNIVRPLSERRHMNGKDIESKEEIGTEATFGNFTAKVAIRCGNHTDINSDGVTADAFDGSLLQYAKEHGLNIAAEFADFIEKQSALVRLFESPNTFFGCSGKRSRFVPKQFARK